MTRERHEALLAASGLFHNRNATDLAELVDIIDKMERAAEERGRQEALDALNRVMIRESRLGFFINWFYWRARSSDHWRHRVQCELNNRSNVDFM